jgi:hypothetical protein
MTGPFYSGIAIKPGVLFMHGPNRPFLSLFSFATFEFFTYFNNHQKEEPCEGRPSRTVLWEGRGEIPLSEMISGKW